MTAIKKGYTLEVTSWENDGDNYRTKFFTTESKAQAKAIKKMCDELFESENSSIDGIGNSNGCEDTTTEEKIVKFINENPILLDDETYVNTLDTNLKIEKSTCLDCCSEWAYELMGYSDFYNYRVCESCDVTYSALDVKTEKVTF